MTRIRAVEAAAAFALGIAALTIAARAGVSNLDAVPDVLRAVAATLVLVSIAGYAPARLLVSSDLWPHFWVCVLLVGSASVGLGLTALGFLGLPFGVSLAVLLSAGLVAGGAVRARLGPARTDAGALAAAGGRRLTLAWPIYLAVVLVALLLVPLFAQGSVTVQGTNPDALLGVGAAEFLQHSHPTEIDEALPVDRMPLVWRSKYPIYYVLAGASSLSGLDPTETFAAFSAVLAALTAAAFMLVARHVLGAGPRAAVLTMAVVGLDGAVTYLALHPYHNQLWGTMALAPILLFGLRLLSEPNRRDAVLLAGFLLLGLAAYPLMVLFPALALAAAAAVSYRSRLLRIRRPRMPRSSLGWAGWVLAALLAAPAVLVVGLGVFEKSGSAAELLVSGGSLGPWRGDLDHYLPPGFFIGVGGVAGYVTAALVLAAAVLGVARLPAVQRAAFAAMIAGGVLFGVYFRLREFGEYFYFKVLAFLAPVVLVIAVAWLASRAGRSVLRGPAIAGAAAVVLVALQFGGLRSELSVTVLQLDAQTLELGDAAGRLPEGASLRVDVLPDGSQLWAGYVLSGHPLSTLTPLTGTTYPHLPVGRKADFIVADSRLDIDPWPDSEGRPLFDNGKFRLYRMLKEVPGPDLSSKRMVDPLGDSFD